MLALPQALLALATPRYKGCQLLVTAEGSPQVRARGSKGLRYPFSVSHGESCRLMHAQMAALRRMSVLGGLGSAQLLPLT
jgi:hypothetical protein